MGTSSTSSPAWSLTWLRPVAPPMAERISASSSARLKALAQKHAYVMIARKAAKCTNVERSTGCRRGVQHTKPTCRTVATSTADPLQSMAASLAADASSTPAIRATIDDDEDERAQLTRRRCEELSPPPMQLLPATTPPATTPPAQPPPASAPSVLSPPGAGEAGGECGGEGDGIGGFPATWNSSSLLLLIL